MEAKKRIQINIAVAPFKWIKVLKKLPKVLLPVVWVDEVSEKNSHNHHIIIAKPSLIIYTHVFSRLP